MNVPREKKKKIVEYYKLRGTPWRELLKHRTTQNDPKRPKTSYNGLRDICLDGRLCCYVTITLTIMHGTFSPLSCSWH